MSNQEQPSQSEAVGIPQWTLGDRMRKALTASGISVQAMADHLELNRMTVGNYMAGRSNPTAATIRTFALRCGVPYTWLRYGQTEATPDGGGSVQGFRESGCKSSPLGGSTLLTFPVVTELRRAS